ncbi:hypothetical protein [Spiroplasma floricola]|uniref:Uncharacterized protein n=1 Tax=Spiroplasma floricola 23-6 TaxID=1336749 RepID=A0A2K8SFJ8_9MOLU|nr:hypothetical protein [Spiroplasma floricola]AUB32028.1 hypothetical protein SFLOR_v1c09800 [Spiroplasma floricola 23-6]
MIENDKERWKKVVKLINNEIKKLKEVKERYKKLLKEINNE